ncbi:MAG: hypothetical protein P4L92_22285 [Rudaea sp.]|nr:hypothetical protein [Rudaea sp.]
MNYVELTVIDLCLTPELPGMGMALKKVGLRGRVVRCAKRSAR